jgi:GTP-binding protein
LTVAPAAEDSSPAVVPAAHLPTVAIVGRPNVGKSTLFNRLIGRRQAIVEDIPGTTRDRLYAEAEWKDAGFRVVDTGGLEPDSDSGYPALIKDQVEIAVAEADVILFVVDATTGITPVDLDVGEMLRRSRKPVVLVANKGDNPARQELAVEFFELALGEPMPISAYHGLGVRELQDRLLELLPPAKIVPDTDVVRVAILGRPNVGKSSLVNVILGESRVIASEAAGTTRDAVDSQVSFSGRQITLVDTAGLRRPGKVEKGIEKYSVMRAREAIDRCDVGIVLVDAEDGLIQQDLHIAGMVLDAYKGLIVALNKWDLVEDSDENRERYARRILSRLRFAPWAPMAFISARTRLNVDGLLELTIEIADNRKTRIGTADLNAALRDAVATHPPPIAGKRQLKLKYTTQTQVSPPTFVIFCNDASLAHFSYRRFLENRFRDRFGFEGTAIKLEFRSRGD